MKSSELKTQPAPAKAMDAEAFYAGIVDRILRTLLVLGIVTLIPILLRFGIAAAIGFAVGATVSYLNFMWLHRAVERLGKRIVEERSHQNGSTIVVRFLLRYLLIGFVVCVILTSWPAALYALLAGLSLPVAAMMGEAALECYVALRSKS